MIELTLLRERSQLYNSKGRFEVTVEAKHLEGAVTIPIDDCMEFLERMHAEHNGAQSMITIGKRKFQYNATDVLWNK